MVRHDLAFLARRYVYTTADFCLWGPPELDPISDTEGEQVAWCSKKGHGTRIMLENTITSAQLLKAPGYWMITGTINQTKLNIVDGDPGGELDSGGQDGVSYSTLRPCHIALKT